MFKNANRITKLDTKIGNLSRLRYTLIEDDLKDAITMLCPSREPAELTIDFSALIKDGEAESERFRIPVLMWDNNGDMASEGFISGIRLSVSGMLWVTVSPTSPSYGTELRHLTQFDQEDITLLYHNLLQIGAEIDADELTFKKTENCFIIKPNDHDA